MDRLEADELVRVLELLHKVTRAGDPDQVVQVVPGTVKKDLDDVYDKLGARGRGPLTALVMGIAP